MGRKFIGIDIGTTFLKGAVIDLEHITVGAPVRVAFPPFITGLPASHREVDPNTIVGAVQELILKLHASTPDCDGIVMCTQMHGLVLADRNGNALSNAITWQDERTLDADADSHQSTYSLMMAQISEQERLALGNDLLPGRPLGALYWMQQHDTGRVDSTADEVYPCSIADFVAAHLCRTGPVTDASNAAAHGAYNLHTADWHHEIISRLRLDHYAWPRIVPYNTVVGYTDMAGHSIPCYVPTGDHQCAVLGTLLGEDELSINASTGSQVGMLTSRFEASLACQTRPYFDGKFLKAVIHIPAGRALAALIRLLSELADAQGVSLPDPWAYVERTSLARADTDLRMNLAFFPSSCGDRGSIDNITEGNLTIGDLFAAACENMAHNYFECAGRIAARHPWSRLVFSGGLMRRLTVLRQSTIRRFGLDCRFAPSDEDTLLGLLVIALMCSGQCATAREASRLVAESTRTTVS